MGVRVRAELLARAGLTPDRPLIHDGQSSSWGPYCLSLFGFLLPSVSSDGMYVRPSDGISHGLAACKGVMGF